MFVDVLNSFRAADSGLGPRHECFEQARAGAGQDRYIYIYICICMYIYVYTYI